MKPSTNVDVGMAAAVSIVVTPDMTVGHFVPGMPQVYATPHMEMAAGLAVAAALPPGYVSVGMSVDIRHIAATPIGGRVRALARVTSVEPKACCSRSRRGMILERSAPERTAGES